MQTPASALPAIAPSPAEPAQGMVEYGLILAFASLTAVAAIVGFGGGLGNEVSNIMSTVVTYVRP